MRLDLIISAHIKVARFFVQKIKNELLISEERENQTGIRLIYCTRSLKTMVIRYLHYIGGKMLMIQKTISSQDTLSDQEKRKASSPKQAFRNYATHTEEITPKCYQMFFGTY